MPFPVTLEFDDAALLRKFVADRLFKARENRMGKATRESMSKAKRAHHSRRR